MKKILWLPGWYPNKIEPFSGDFIQRHAKAVSLYNAVQVIHVLRDKQGIITKKVKEEHCQNENLKEKTIYYYTPVFFIPFLDKIISNNRYTRLYRKAIEEYIHAEGLPACVHVHVVNKNGLLALWLKRKYNISFFISEHWTIYLPNAVPNYKNFNFFFRAMWRRIVKAAEGFSVVSDCLGEALIQIQKDIRFTVIPNVIDDTIFFPAEKKEEGLARFIHISGLDYQKNPAAIFEAFAMVKKENPAFVLSVFGPCEKKLREVVVHLGLQQHVVFYNEVPQPQLAIYMQQSDALILYSRYETFGCVLIEANACGVPAIVSDLPVFHEIIEEGKNGYFVPGENPGALARKIIWFISQSRTISGKAIARTAIEKYNFEKVGKLFNELYNTLS